MKPEFEWRGQEMYFDNAATTLVAEEVVDAMRPYLEERYGNPETVYELGREARTAVEDSRGKVSELLGCKPERVFFTSGGTESNNWAIKGPPRMGIMVSSIEHSSVMEPAKWACKDLPYFEIPVDKTGLVDLVEMEKELMTGRYFLVSVQYVNNEIGTLQPIKSISALCRKYRVLFHCDAVQAFGRIRFDVDDLDVDLMSLSAHKIHGPMGIGALYVKNGVILEPLMHGGGQESGMRSGTLAVHQIVGFGKAVDLAQESIERDMPRISKLVDSLSGDILRGFPGSVRNGHVTQRSPHILSVTIPGAEAGVVCGVLCGTYAMCLSSGAACSTGKVSHVLKAIGCDDSASLSTFRISLSRYNDHKQVILLFCRIQAAIGDAKRRSLL